MVRCEYYFNLSHNHILHLPIFTDFMAQFEVGQQELIDLHHYTYLMDICMMNKAGKLADIVYSINKFLLQHIYFSMQGRNNYHKLMDLHDFAQARKYINPFQQTFLTSDWFSEYIGTFHHFPRRRSCLTLSLTYTSFRRSGVQRNQPK